MTKKITEGFFKFHWKFMRSGYGKKIGAQAGWVLCALASRADQHGGCFPSNETISRDTGLSISSVITAKKVLKENGLIDYWNRKNESGKTTSQGYKIYPVKTPDLRPKDPASIAGDLKGMFDVLEKLEAKYPTESIYLRANSKTLEKMDVMPSSLRAAIKSRIKDLLPLRIYFSLTTFHTLRVSGRRIKKPFYAKLPGNVENLVSFVNAMVGSAKILECPYEDAILKFMEWVKEKKRGKTLNFGIIPLLGVEWMEGLE